MKRIVFHVVCIAGLLLLCGCATAHRPFTYQPGAVVNTLSAGVSLSISKGEQGMGSSGYLLYQRPDRLRLVILSPFGTSLMEVTVNGDRITIIDNSSGAAFSGVLDDLPRTGQGETWRHARWVLDMDPPGTFAGDGSQQRVNGSGDRERVTFANGLAVSKSLDNGDMVRYRDYETVNGVPLATEIIMDSHDGGRFRIKLSEPEVNADLAPDAFLPRIDGFQLYPLELLQGR
jgi:outer membrane lipoprotein-sorting protein